MSPYKHIEVANKPESCPTCGSDLILITGKDNPIYICGECGQPLFQISEEGEEKHNANKVFAHFTYEEAFCPFPLIHVHAAYDRVKREVAIYGDFSTMPNKDEETAIKKQSISRVLSRQSVEEFLTMEEKESDFCVLDGNTYSLTIWDGDRKRTIDADDSNVHLYSQFRPFVAFAEKYFRQNIEKFWEKKRNNSD